MSAQDLLRDLRSSGVGVSARDGYIDLDAPRGLLTDELLEAVAQAKPRLLKLVAQECRRLEEAGEAMNEIGAVVCEVYAVGASLVVLDGGLAVDGEIPNELTERVRAHRDELLEVLVGDPLEGFGWEARTALYRQALRWLDGKVEKMGPKDSPMERTVISALCQQDVTDSLNAAWCGEDFEGFRAALREYVRVGLHAAKSKDRRCNSNEPAAVTAHQSH
jgi:hypothetical protein